MSDSRHCPHCGKPLPGSALGGLCPECMLKVGAATQTADDPLGDTAAPVPTPPLDPATLAPHFPHLEILECLGRGGMGVVYKACQATLNRLVALKVLAPEKSRDLKFAGRFTREAQALARLNHPNIVTIHDFGETGGLFYLLMEFVDGVSLRQLLERKEIAPETALAIVPRICEALQYAHEQGIVHRDIKPENVLLDRAGRVKIADFGIAKILGEEAARPTLTEERQVIGTPHYMAPEQVEKPLLVDHRADIYSLGVVFYEMLTGELPLGRFAPPSRKVQVDVRLDQVVLHALEKEPERRYQHASEVKTDVERIAGEPQSGLGGSESEVRSPKLEASPRADGSLKLEREDTQPESRLEARRRAALWYGFLVSLAGFPLGLALGLPFVSMLALPGIVVGAVKLGLVQRGKRWWVDWQRARAARRASGVPRPACGATDSFTTLLLVLPSVLFVLWLLEGDRLWPVALEAEVRFYLAVIGLPLAAACGALLAWATRGPGSPPGAGRPEAEVGKRRRWSWRALGAVAMLALSLPLGGGAAVLWELIREDGSWNPSSAEAVFTLTWGALTLLTILSSVLFGVGALREMHTANEPLRGRLGALAATWLWPCLCLTVLATSRQPAGSRQAIDPQDVVRTEQLLRNQIQERLAAIGWQADFSVSVSKDVRRAECRLAQLQRNGLIHELLGSAINLRRQRNGLWLVEGRGELHALRFSVATGTAPLVQVHPPDQAGFDPVREVVLRRGPELEGAFLRLETGEVLSMPAPIAQGLRASGQLSKEGGVQVLAILDWMRTNGADLVCRDGPSGLTLVDGMGVLLASPGAGQPALDAVTAPHVVQLGAMLAEPLALHTNREPQGMAIFWFEPHALEHTWAIRTRNGRVGVIEVRPDDVEPGRIRFRYKLVAHRWDVAGDGSGAHASIQVALLAATNGAVIRIGPGRYDERLTITNSVTLLGASWSQTVIGPTRPWNPPPDDTVRTLQQQLREAPDESSRQRIRERMDSLLPRPIVSVRQAGHVELRGLKLVFPGVAPDGKLLNTAVLDIVASEVSVADCASVGSPGNGLQIANGSTLAVSNTLVAAAWNTGIAVLRGGRPSSLTVTDSDLRNCYYAGITIGRGQGDTRIERCRVSGSAWHGIRYDDAGPLILDCLIFGNARSGIYASGKTSARLRGNVLWKNEMNGMSGWFENRDRLDHNTFAANQREGLAILGASQPILERNVFWGHPHAVFQGPIAGDAATAKTTGKLLLTANVFWTNAVNLAVPAAKPADGQPSTESLPLADFPSNREVDPGFADPARGDFTRPEVAASAAPEAGATTPLSLASPWPLQAEELAIIPPGETRDYQHWRRLGPP